MKIKIKKIILPNKYFNKIGNKQYKFSKINRYFNKYNKYLK
jgi:hypothetical protein